MKEYVKALFLGLRRLTYRIDALVESYKHLAKETILNYYIYLIFKNFIILLTCFQLNMCREERLIFEDFKEGQITFPPTYKFDVGTDSYDTRYV